MATAEFSKVAGILRPSRTNMQKDVFFRYRGLECKSMKSRNAWNNRQIGPGIKNENVTNGHLLVINYHD